MASAIDAAQPVDNVKVDKALQRQNWAAAKSEIEALQLQSNQIRKLIQDDSAFTEI
jgi:hypothetical protein